MHYPSYDREMQGIGWNVQVEVGQAVDNDIRYTAKTPYRDPSYK